MKLSAILDGVQATVSGGDPGADVTGFAIDHRKVAPGNVFGAFQGAKFNGETFIPAAIEAGAIAVVAAPTATVAGAMHISGEQPRQIFAHAAAQFFAPVPTTIVAVTGTNGKTSCVEMTRQIWRMCGERAASIGTLGVTTPDESVSTGLTTPDIVTFLSNMSGLAREGVTHVAYEASSHGLSQFRNEGVSVTACAFTNFSRDHLDYHGTMDDYFAAKMRLFSDVVAPGSAAIIWDGGENCEWTRRAIEHAKASNLRVLVVGKVGDEQTAFLRLAVQEATPLGQNLTLVYDGHSYKVTLPLIGAYQAANAVVSAGLALATGCSPSQVFDAMDRLQPVRGRLERAAIAQSGAPVYVDYAHTPDALEAAIVALRPHVQGRLLVVFGAGGDRDQGKRKPMGQTASAHADWVVVTDDNPRGEDPAVIRKQILDGVDRNAIEIGDRREAIAHALAEAEGEDIILIAGKGHEEGQIVGSGEAMQVLPFNDVQVAREEASRIGKQTWDPAA